MKHIAANLPAQLRSALVDLLVASGFKVDPDSISNLLSKVITSYDDSLTKDLYDIFPGGREELRKLTDDEVKAVIHDCTTNGPNHAKVARCMQGSTVLVSLIDPNRDNIWVASLGDCQAGVSLVSFCHVRSCVERWWSAGSPCSSRRLGRLRPQRKSPCRHTLRNRGPPVCPPWRIRGHPQQSCSWWPSHHPRFVRLLDRR